ncbi:MAG: nucleotidyltransferase family protein [Bacillota bacterium]|nr:nucleotidyltransferase family protein [Bacillota bacterium]
MKEINDKLEVLTKIAKLFNEEKITWAVGASLLLYFKGKTDHFNDIDLMVDEKDIEKVKAIMLEMGTLMPPHPKAKYKTRHFLEYVVDGIDIDVMAGFVIVKDGVDYDCSLMKKQIVEIIEINKQKIPLQSLELWKYYYSLMGRENKARMIDGNN